MCLSTISSVGAEAVITLYPLSPDGALRTLDHRITDPAVIADLDRGIGLTYC